jgi:hypothetical protein
MPKKSSVVSSKKTKQKSSSAIRKRRQKKSAGKVPSRRLVLDTAGKKNLKKKFRTPSKMLEGMMPGGLFKQDLSWDEAFSMLDLMMRYPLPGNMH